MNSGISYFITRLGDYDRYLLFTVVLIAGTGMVMLYSASSGIVRELGDSEIYLKGNFVRLLIGFAIMAVTMRIDYRLYKKIAVPLLLAALLLLAGGLIHHRIAGGGPTARWIYVGGISVQTSEFMKFALIAYIAYYLDKKKHKIGSFFRRLAPVRHSIVDSICADTQATRFQFKRDARYNRFYNALCGKREVKPSFCSRFDWRASDGALPL